MLPFDTPTRHSETLHRVESDLRLIARALADAGEHMSALQVLAFGKIIANDVRAKLLIDGLDRESGPIAS